MKKEKECGSDRNDQTNFDISGNMIEETRRIIAEMNETQRFQKAKAHIYDALNYKHPRFESESLTTPPLFKLAYSFQSSSIWSWILFLSSYVFICLAALDSEYYVGKIVSEAVILSLFWVDNIITLYCKSFDQTKEHRRYSSFFYIKFIIIILMTVDLIIFICLPCFSSRPIRPLRILRCMVLVLFDPQTRKCLISLASAYKDILVYLIFYSIIIVGYAFIGNKTLTFDPSFKDPNFPQLVDPYRTNYGNLSAMIFIIYVNVADGAPPDNQSLAMQSQEYNCIYFFIFVFLNMFLFSSIPGSLIYFRFKEMRSKILLIDEIKQRESLLLAFVTLANQSSHLSLQQLINFFLFLYRYKIRYVEYIADICIKLDAHSKNAIQANQFMQMSRIILENSALLPPALDDFTPWVSFRKYINERLYFKQIASTWVFELIVSILILLAFINSVFYMSNPTDLVQIFDKIFAWLFFIELLIRIIAFGPQLFFLNKWNIIDTILVIAGIAVIFTSSDSGSVLLKIGRLFRISGIIRIVSHSNFIKQIKFQLLQKLIDIYVVLIQILPIILRFFPLFVFFFYIYGIIAMQIFYNFYDTRGVQPYNQYRQFSNFKTLQNSFYTLIQVLSEGGWALVAMDHCWSAPKYFGYIMVFFCFLHITIVYILATLVKGVFWEVYVTVKHVLNERSKIAEEEEDKQEQLRKKRIQINEINKQIQSKEYIKPKTIMRRDLIQNRIDEEIFRSLIKELQKPKTEDIIEGRSKAKRFTSALIPRNFENTVNIPVQRTQSMSFNMSLGQIEEIDDQDVKLELLQLLDIFIVDPIYKYHEIVSTPKVFIDYIKAKIITDFDQKQQNQDDLHSYPLQRYEAINFHVSEIKSLLSLQVSKRKQKTLIMSSLVRAKVITQQQSERLIKKKLNEKKFQIDTRGIMRQAFLDGTNEDLIQKLYTQYFSGLYGSSYKHISRLTLEPLLKLQAKLTYSLRNIMRYPQIDHIDFFQILTAVQSNISKQLLQKGSIFKYIFKLDYEGEIWFWIQCKKPSQDLKIHFMKNGVWCYFEQMNEKEIYYARDVFNWNFAKQSNPKDCAELMKKFFQTFQSFSFSLEGQQDFFEDDPKKYIYDLYIQLFNVQKNKRYITYKAQIQKIMVVILSKKELRKSSGLQNIHYSLSDIKLRKQKYKVDLSMQQKDQQILSKLKNLGADETEKIVQNQGLPFSYIIDLMKEMKEILDVSVNNLIYQTEKAFNKQYDQKRQKNLYSLVYKNSSRLIKKSQLNKQNTEQSYAKGSKKDYSEYRMESKMTLRDQNIGQDHQ